jgi:hypothetical protein
LSNTYGNGHSNNSQPKPIQQKNSVNVSKKEALEELQTTFGSIRKKFDPKLSNSSMFAIIQDNPCLVKCLYEIRNRNAPKLDFDSFYNAKHTWIKNKIIDAILDKFENQIEVKSEHNLSNGKFDPLQILYDKIQIQYKTKTIAIEIKSGKTVNSKIFFQIERYLVDTDVLLMVRVPTQDVVPIHSDEIMNELIEDLSLLRRKADKILSNSVKKVPGDWCRECNAECEFKKSHKWNSSSPKGSFEGFEEDLKNVNMVIAKLIVLIERSLEEFKQISNS